MVIFKRKHPFRNVRLAEINIANALVYRVGEYVPVQDQNIRRPIPVIPKALKAIQRKPKRHAFPIHLIRPCPLRTGEELSDFPTKKAIIGREVTRGNGVPARKQSIAQQAVLHAFAASVNPFNCDNSGFFHQICTFFGFFN